MCERDDFDRWLTGPIFLPKREIGCNSYDGRGILSVVEKVVNEKPKKEVFFENSDDFNVSLMLGSNNRHKENNTEMQNVLNTLQRRLNFGVASVKRKHSLNTNVIDNYR